MTFLFTGLRPVAAQIPNYAWAKQAGGLNYSNGNAIVTDAAGNSYVAGYFNNTVTFGATTLSGNGNSCMFIAKLNPGLTNTIPRQRPLL